MQVAQRGEIVQVPAVAGIFQAGLNLVVAAAVDRDLALIFEHVLRRDVDHPRRAQAVFRWQGAGQQLNLFRQARAQRLAEHAEALG